MEVYMIQLINVYQSSLKKGRWGRYHHYSETLNAEARPHKNLTLQCMRAV